MGLLDRLIRKSNNTPAATAGSPAETARDKPPAPPPTDTPAGDRDRGPDRAPDRTDEEAPRRRSRRRGGRGRRRGAGSRPPAEAEAGRTADDPRDSTPARSDDQRERSRGAERDSDEPRGDRPPRRRRGGRGRGQRGPDDRGPAPEGARGEAPDGPPRPASNGDRDGAPSRARTGAPAGGRASAAARKALSSGGYQLPPLNIVDSIDPADYPAAFREMGLSDRALAVMASLGFDSPTPIQEEAVPVMLDGQDVVGQAQTGTGKTLAFGLLIVERLDPENRNVQAVVLVPTRELAQQVFGVLEFLAEAMGLRAVPLVGGRKLNDDFNNLEKRPQIVVGTPGRIIDHLNRGSLDLHEVRVAVLDEADRMLDIGFEPDMRRILGRCPDDRQTALFSATIPTPIKTLIWRYMHEPEHIQIEPEQATAREISQRYFEVAEQDKLKALSELLPEMRGRTLIFCNMKVTVDRLVRRLVDRGIAAEAIHGDLDQRKRDRVMERFRAGELQFLVATNVASRGLDIPDLNHVVNFDLPQNADEYVHRVGRTGRAGREGSAITFVSEWDYDSFDAIKQLAGSDLEPGDLSLYAHSR